MSRLTRRLRMFVRVFMKSGRGIAYLIGIMDEKGMRNRKT